MSSQSRTQPGSSARLSVVCENIIHAVGYDGQSEGMFVTNFK